MIIGKKNHIRGTWSYGIEFSLDTPQNRGTTPRFEIWCFKLLSYPPKDEVINKNRDLVGLWRIFWLERDPLTTVSIVRRKGFRDRQITQVRGRWHLRSW